MKRCLCTLTVTALLAGCGAMPSKVSLPKHLSESKVDPNGRPTDAGDARDAYDGMVGDMGIQPVAMSRAALLYQINLLIGDWNAKASTLLGERDVADNATFWGMAAAAALMMSNEVKAAKYTAGAVAGVKLVEDNYKTVIQASNYSTAAEAVECVRTQVVGVSPTTWARYFDDKGNVIGVTDPEQQAALTQTFSQINGALSSIYKKLRSNQRAVRVTAPTADSISKAISDTQAQAGIVNGVAERSRAALADEQKFIQLKLLLAVGGNAQTCATAMGG